MAVLAPVPPEPVTIAGRTLNMSALADIDHIELDRWAQSMMIDAARRSVPDGDPRLWDRVVGLAMREALSVSWANSRLIKTRAGYAHIMWIAFNKQIAETELVELIERCTQEERKLMNMTFMRLNYGGQDDKPNPRLPGE